ncbi:MAG: peptidoglycan-associated lipoprotein Pal [Deltaproteobacteria bacterium]|nr:peptidoglycan-associated lipoprotein Pal [Deltaproteobacteria bacterium]
MQKRLLITLTFCFFVSVMLFTTACTKKVVSTAPVTDQTAEDSTAQQVEEIAGDLEESTISEADAAALAAEALAAEERAAQENAAREKFINEDIYFKFDSSVLSLSSQDTLKLKGIWMMQYSDVSVIIEGHCDERGTSEYNIALGDRRAESVKKFMVDIGIAQERLTTISYGEERPLFLEHNEDAWAKNRRVHFVLE